MYYSIFFFFLADMLCAQTYIHFTVFIIQLIHII